MRVIGRVTRNDGYEFFAFRAKDDRCIVLAGCRGPWTTAEYRKHVKASYPKTAKAIETLAILDFIDARAKVDKKEPARASEHALRPKELGGLAAPK